MQMSPPHATAASSVAASPTTPPSSAAKPPDVAGLAEAARARRSAAEAAIRRGELAAALDALRDELALRRRVLELDPDDAQARESVARTAARLADVLVFRSSLAG